MESKYVHSPQSLSSSLTLDTFKSRKPRFQRQNTSGKCECKSASKSRLSCDSLSLEKFYVKKSFLKSPETPLNHENNVNFSKLSIFEALLEESGKIDISSSRIENKTGCEFLEDSNNFLNLKEEKSIFNEANELLNYKEKIDQSLKEAIFLKEKCQKQEMKIKDLIMENEKITFESNKLKEENIRLKIEIQNLKKCAASRVSEEEEKLTTSRKPRISMNKNLSKLKQEYLNFREEEDMNRMLASEKVEKLMKNLEELRFENDKLKKDIVQERELCNMKRKMMEEKEDFLEKTLSFTKNALAQLQKDYSEKQLEILESKRLNEIISEKCSHIERIEAKYSNLLKIVNGNKRRTDNLKSVKNKPEKSVVPAELRSRHSLETKNTIFGHKENKIDDKFSGREPTYKNQEKFDKNSIVIKIVNNQIKTKENYRITEIKSTLNLPAKETEQVKSFQRSNSDLTLSSFNSFELSPEK